MQSLTKAIELFGNSFTMVDENLFVSSDIVDVPNLPDILAQYEIESQDVGKKVDVAMSIFGVNIIWLNNSLNLVQENWEVLD